MELNIKYQTTGQEKEEIPADQGKDGTEDDGHNSWMQMMITLITIIMP
jgi:hypothetical protein